MTKKVFNMQGGLHSAAAYSAFENRVFGSVKANVASFAVSAGTGMNVQIAAGDGLIDTGQNFARRIQTDAVETAAVAAASPSYSRIDSVVAYIDNAVVPTTSVVDNTNGVLKFAAVAGTAAATPLAPSAASIQSSIGAGNPYLILANVTVPANATNLTAATFNNIAPTPLLAHYPIGAIYISVVNTDPSALFGGTWQVFATGKTLVGIDTSQTEFNTIEKTGGAKTHTLTTNEMPAHGHNLGGKGIVNSSAGNGANLQTTGSGYQVVVATTEGGGQPHNNLQPYITTYMWKRTA